MTYQLNPEPSPGRISTTLVVLLLLALGALIGFMLALTAIYKDIQANAPLPVSYSRAEPSGDVMPFLQQAINPGVANQPPFGSSPLKVVQ